jgi:O-antigen/teichoic acid export membrane protein
MLNYVISKEYPWLKTDKSRGREILKKYPDILVKAKQIVIHRLKNFFLSKSDEILIFAFESLRMVTYYGNYIMIVGKLTELVNNVFTGMNASIGNLVAEGNINNTKKVFWEFCTFRYWTTGIFVICMIFLINPIITWWLGAQYILKDHIVYLIILNMYIMLTRPAVDLFINAYGLFDDVWAAYAEGITNVTITIIIGYHFGLVGILLGKIISMLFFVVIWKPYFLFKRGIKSSCRYYWINIIRHYIILGICLLAVYLYEYFMRWSIPSTITEILTYVMVILLPIIIIYTILVYITCPGAKDLVKRLPLFKNSNNNLI